VVLRTNRELTGMFEPNGEEYSEMKEHGTWCPSPDNIGMIKSQK